MTQIEWEIWHSSLSYFINSIEETEMEFIAKLFIEKNFAILSYYSDDKIWWKGNENSKIRYGSSTIDHPSDMDLIVKNYVEESAMMRKYELMLFTSLYINTFKYIRSHLKFILLSIPSQDVIKLYPILKIYNNGLINFTLREIVSIETGDNPTDGFINNHVNLLLKKFNYIAVPCEWIMCYINSKYFKNKAKYKDIISKVDSKTLLREVQGYEFRATFLDEELLGLINLKRFTIFEILRDIIIEVIYSIINLKFPEFSGPIIENDISKFWISRKSIYVFDFEDKNGIGKIMAKVDRPGNFEGFLTKDLHEGFEDYALYINEVVTLYAVKDKIYNKLFILERQIISESINFVYISYVRLAERSNMPFISYNSSIYELKNMIDFHITIRHTSRYNELNKIYLYIVKEFELERILNHSIKRLELQAEFIKVERENKLLTLGLIFSLLFGVISIITFSNNVMPRLWNYYGFWMPDDINKIWIYFYISTSILYMLVFFIIWKIANPRLKGYVFGSINDSD